MVKRVAMIELVVLVLGVWAGLAPGAFLRPGVQPDGKSTTPALSTDANGRAYLVWVDRQKGPPGLFFNRSDDGGTTWQGIDRQIYLSPSEESKVYEPVVWGDGRGNVYAVWRLRHQGDEIWFAASRDFGVTWEPGIRISSRGTGFLPHLKADRQGRVYVVWYEELARGKDYAVHFNSSSDGGATWSARDLRLDAQSPPGTAALPQLASDERGHVYVVWREARHGPQEVMFITSADAGRTWSRPIRLSQANSHTEHPKVTTDGAGHVYVTWMDWRHGGRPDIYFTVSADHGKTWLSKEIRLNTNAPGSAEAYGQQLGATPQGHVYVTWMDRRNGKPDVFFTRSADHGKTWQGNALLSTLGPDGSKARLPRLAADEGGRTWVVWEDLGPQPKLFYAVSADWGTTWRAREVPIPPFDSSTYVRTPSLGILPGGKLALAWEERRPPKTLSEGLSPALLPSDVTVRQLSPKRK